MRECSLSKNCPVHSERREIRYGGLTAGFNEFEKIYDTTGNPELDNQVKELLCRLVNDRALDSICRKYGIMIDKIEEIPFYNPMHCLGYNQGKGIKIAVVLRMMGEILDYEDAIGVILHEFTHCFHDEHYREFMVRDQKLR